MRAYLARQGVSDETFLEAAGWVGRYVSERGVTALGRLLLTCAPDGVDHIAAILGRSGGHALMQFVRLLLADDPPRTDDAWQVAQRVPRAYRGTCAAYLLAADPPRFRTWAREV